MVQSRSPYSRSVGGSSTRAPWRRACSNWASTSSTRTLISHDLVDLYRLMIEPVRLGGGKRLFPDDGQARPLELVSAMTSKTGVQICTYGPGR